MKKLKLHWVSDIIGNEYLDWSAEDVIKIQCQTGTGKTWFIMNKLMKNMCPWDKMLIICNRVALKRQMKLELLQNMREVIPKKGNKIDWDIIDSRSEFGGIHVTSYQALGKLYKEYKFGSGSKFNIENFKYIIADECHYFYKSGFDPNAQYAIEQVITEGNKSIKIYISATMGTLNKVLDKALEQSGQSIIKKPRSFEYKGNNDYSYINTSYFRDIKSLVKIINDDISEKKWLIFVNTGKEADEIKDSLNCSFDFINASKKRNKVFKDIVENQRFGCKVLITTTVIDNGVNIKDDDLANIVLFIKDETTFIQCLGRIRYKNLDNSIYANETNLYIPVSGINEFIRMKNKHNLVKEEIDLFHDNSNKFNAKYESTPNDNEYKKIKSYIEMIFKNNNGWKTSKLGLAIFNDEVKYVNDMINKFNERHDLDEWATSIGAVTLVQGKFTFVYERLKWLGLEHTFSSDNLVEDEMLKNEKLILEEYLDKVTGIKLFDNEQQKLNNLIIKRLANIPKDIDYRTKKLKPSTLENMLRDDLNLKYTVESGRETKGVMRKKRYIIINKY